MDFPSYKMVIFRSYIRLPKGMGVLRQWLWKRYLPKYIHTHNFIYICTYTYTHHTRMHACMHAYTYTYVLYCLVKLEVFDAARGQSIPESQYRRCQSLQKQCPRRSLATSVGDEGGQIGSASELGAFIFS